MPDDTQLLKAIRLIVREEVREEVQPLKDDLYLVKEDLQELKQDMGEVKDRLARVEQKVEDMPAQMIEMISSPLIQEDDYQDARITRLEKHNHLPPLPRPE